MAADKPWPREPVDMSMPGVRMRSQWLGRRVPPQLSVCSQAWGEEAFVRQHAVERRPGVTLGEDQAVAVAPLRLLGRDVHVPVVEEHQHLHDGKGSADMPARPPDAQWHRS